MSDVIALLRARIHYNPETGEMHEARTTLCGERVIGKLRKSRNGGYIKFFIEGKTYLAHRIAWMLVYGKEPCGSVDHINGDRSDNRIANLRECSNQQNCANSTHARGSLGVRGVSLMRSGKFKVQIKRDGKSYHLGYFTNIEDAESAYKAASISMNGEFSPYAQRAQAQKEQSK